MKRKLLSIILVASTILSSVSAGSSIATSTVYAKEKNKNTIQEILPIPKEDDYKDVPQSRSVGTKVVKAAIKFIKKNKTKAASIIGKVAGKTAKNNFLKYYSKIIKALNPLLKWTNLPSQAVYDAVFRGLYNAGVSRKVATNVALAIKEAISWLV